jgi:hypothetical protein
MGSYSSFANRDREIIVGRESVDRWAIRSAPDAPRRIGAHQRSAFATNNTILMMNDSDLL